MKQLAACLLLGLIPIAALSAQDTFAPGIAVPSPSPPFSLKTLEGKAVTFEQFRGKVLLIDVFNTACHICKENSSALEALYRKYRSQGFEVLGVSYDQAGPLVVKPFVDENKLTYPIVIGDADFAVRYLDASPQRPNMATPFIFLIDKKAVVRKKYPGGADKGELEKEILRLLEEK